MYKACRSSKHISPQEELAGRGAGGGCRVAGRGPG